MSTKNHSKRRSAPRCLGLALLAVVTLGWPAMVTAQSAVKATAESIEPMILEMEGKVEISRAGSQLWDPAYTNQVLRAGDRVQTGPRSRAVIRWSNRTLFRMEARSIFSVPSQPGGRRGARLLKGLLYFFHRDDPGEFPVETPTAYAVVVGTEFVVEVADDGATVLRLIEGVVDLSNRFGQLQLKSGEAGIVERGKAPAKTAVIAAINAVQWCLYYPGILHLDELALGEAEQAALGESVAAYRAGDLVAALAKYPADRQPASAPEKIYLAALLLGVGQVREAEELLGSVEGIAPPLPGPSPPARGGEGERMVRLAGALRKVIAAVKGEPAVGTGARTAEARLRFPYTAGSSGPSDPSAVQPKQRHAAALQTAAPPHPGPLPPSRGGEGEDVALLRAGSGEGEGPAKLATEWLAESYEWQSRFRLEEALAAAKNAVEVEPDFAFGWERVAELEFSFGRIHSARAALERSFALAPRNAQALALQGFLLAAANKTTEAIEFFDRAIAVDGALGNAWLGRGLCRLRQGQAEAGREDLQVAATVEPQRAILRSYLGKAFSQVGHTERSMKELDLAKALDANDPTAWLYSALLNQEGNRINEAVRDLEHSQELNDHRAVYRSQFLLDQDRAVRGANLASIYQDAAMPEVAFREAARAVNADYANYSAHLFLANSYDNLRDPNQVNQRYETPWLSEYLVANLLAPVGAGTLSQNVSQQEYSRLFERNRLGLVSSTEYLSRGDWTQSGAQFGILDNFSYALDGYYRSRNGQRPNDDIEQLSLSLQLKQQLTPADSVYLQAIYYDAEGGDLAQYYDPADANPGVRVQESQEPLLLAGYHHEWSPGSHTLFLAGRLQDTVEVQNPARPTLLVTRNAGIINGVNEVITRDQVYRNDLEIYTSELQQILQRGKHTWIAGGRYQNGEYETKNQEQTPFGATLSRENVTDFERANAYAYWHWQALPSLLLMGGLSYDWLEYPRNFRFAPLIAAQEDTEDRLSPKGGVIWTPLAGTTVRAGYAQSLGGVSFDQSFQLEPTQIGGFNQAWRSMIPESVAGANSAAKFENWGLSLEQKLGRGTYLGLSAQVLRSEVDRHVGAYELVSPLAPLLAVNTPQRLEFEERALGFTLNQLLSEDWSLGVRYHLSSAELKTDFQEIPGTADIASGIAFRPRQDLEATLHQVNLYAQYTHASGYFGQVESLWNGQSNEGYAPGLPGDSFWQFNAFVGYRFPRRRVEVRLGVLNIGDQDYRLNPLNVTAELSRERTLLASLRFRF